MHRLAACALTLLVLAAMPRVFARDAVHMIEVAGEGAKYWPRWRGPSGQGVVAPGKYTNVWSPSSHLKWRVPLAGEGNSSPIVWADRIFLTAAQDNGARLSMVSFDRGSGKKLWETFLPQVRAEWAHFKNGHASATPVTDGQLVYASFGSNGLAAFEFSTGKIAWQQRVGAINNYHGPAGSPVLYKDRLFIYQDGESSSFVAAFDAKTGRKIWETPRRATVGWGTPIVINAGNRDELIVSSQGRVTAYDPQSGRELWIVGGNTYEVIPTPVVGHGLVFCSSGRAGPTIAIRPGGSGDVTSTHVAWSTPRGSPFVPSGLVHEGLLYLINDMQSILTVYDAQTGALAYQGRLGVAQREGFSSSPVAVNGEVFLTNDDGETFVVKAGRQFTLLHTNTLGERTLASPALVDGVWYWRTARSLIAIQ